MKTTTFEYAGGEMTRNADGEYFWEAWVKSEPGFYPEVNHTSHYYGKKEGLAIHMEYLERRMKPLQRELDGLAATLQELARELENAED